MLESLDQNQIIFILTVMTASAVVTGFMAGFFGIGGGLIMVPILFYLFSFAGIEQTFVMHLALGTSFSISLSPIKAERNSSILFFSIFLSEENFRIKFLVYLLQSELCSELYLLLV